MRELLVSQPRKQRRLFRRSFAGDERQRNHRAERTPLIPVLLDEEVVGPELDVVELVSELATVIERDANAAVARVDHVCPSELDLCPRYTACQ